MLQLLSNSLPTRWSARTGSKTKGCGFFPFWDPQNPLREVDVFVESPILFEDLWRRSEIVELGTTSTRIASISDHIFLKSLADRPEDRQDIGGSSRNSEAQGTPMSSEQPRSESWGGWSESRERKFTVGLQATPRGPARVARRSDCIRSPRGGTPQAPPTSRASRVGPVNLTVEVA